MLLSLHNFHQKSKQSAQFSSLNQFSLNNQPLLKQQRFRVILLTCNEGEFLRITFSLVEDADFRRCDFEHLGDIIDTGFSARDEVDRIDDCSTAEIVETDTCAFDTVAGNRDVLHIKVIAFFQKAHAVPQLLFCQRPFVDGFENICTLNFKHPCHIITDINTCSFLFCTGDERFKRVQFYIIVTVLIRGNQPVVDLVCKIFTDILPEKQHNSCDNHYNTDSSDEYSQTIPSTRCNFL